MRFVAAASLPFWLIISPFVILFLFPFLCRASFFPLSNLCFQLFAAPEETFSSFDLSASSSVPLSIGVLCCQLGAHRSGRAPITRSFFSLPTSRLLSVALCPSLGSTLRPQLLTTCLVQIASSLYISPIFFLSCTIRRRCVTQRGLEISRAGELNRALIVETSADSSLFFRNNGR